MKILTKKLLKSVIFHQINAKFHAKNQSKYQKISIRYARVQDTPAQKIQLRIVFCSIRYGLQASGYGRSFLTIPQKILLKLTANSSPYHKISIDCTSQGHTKFQKVAVAQNLSSILYFLTITVKLLSKRLCISLDLNCSVAR